jgi:threonine/homoserine/homoserine lactone efflux protein
MPPLVQAALAFLPFAALLAVLPGPATAMVIQSAARGGRAHAMRATAGDAAGLALWAVASMLGVSALVTALSNPKVGLFYIALLPQFVPAGTPVLPATLVLAAIQISLSCGWYFVLASAVGRAREAFTRHRARLQAATGALMIGFGLKVLADQR